MEEAKVGHIAVDSGMVIVSDPVYRRPDDWRGFVRPLKAVSTQIGAEESWKSQAVVVGGFGGDGVYPVFIRRNEQGIVSELVVKFEERIWPDE